MGLVAAAPVLLGTRRRAMWTLFFFAPFHEVAVASLGAFTTTVRLPYVVALLWMIRESLTWILRGRIPLAGRSVRIAVGLFGVAVVASAFMPVIAGGTLVIHPESSVATLSEVQFTPLRWTRNSLTQLAYPAFLLVLFLVARRAIHDDERMVRAAVTGFLTGSGAVLVLGLAYQLGIAIGLERLLLDLYETLFAKEPYEWYFRPVVGPFPRMYTMAGEPGYAGMLFAVAAAMCARVELCRRSGAGEWTAVGLFFALGALATGSTTGWLAVPIALALALAYPVGGASLGVYLRRGVAALVVTATTIVLFAAMPVSDLVVDYFLQNHLSKLTEGSGSGATRLFVVTHNLDVFRRWPLLGVGWGNDRSLSGGAFLLANVGLVGYGLFLALLAVSVSQHRGRRVGTTPGLSDAASVAVMVTLVLIHFAKSEAALLFVYFWLLLAVAGREPGRVQRSIGSGGDGQASTTRAKNDPWW